MLAISLRAVTDALRDEQPLNKKYPIAELLDACAIGPASPMPNALPLNM